MGRRGQIGAFPRVAALCAVSCCLGAPPTWAAGPTSVPEGFEPAQIERQVGQMPLPDTRTDPVELPAARTQVELDERAFTLAGVLVEGATAYSNLDFLKIYRPWLGRAVTVRELREIAEAITRRYHEDGYFLSNAILPAQDIAFGVVRIRVIEGHVGNWRYADDAPPDALVDDTLQPALAQRPLRRAALVSALKRVNTIPGLTVTPELRALPRTPGVYELVLAAQARRFEGGISFDNRGSELIGPLRTVATLRAHGLVGGYESLQLKLATAAESEELRYAEVSGEWLLGAQGLRLELLASTVRSQPGGELAAFDARIANDRQRLALSKGWGGADREHRLRGYLERYHSSTHALGERQLRDRLHMLGLSYRLAWAASGGSVQTVTASIGQGLGGDSEPAGAGRTDFTRLRADYAWRRQWRGDWDLSANAEGQYAMSALPSAERYTVGGGPFGSAYDPSEISGDHGLAGRIELARRARTMSRDWRYSPYGGYELAAVWNVEHADRAARLSAASLFAGVRIGGGGVSLTLEAAYPLTRAVASQEDREPRIFALLSYRF